MPYLRVKNELPLIPGYASGDIASIADGVAGAPIHDIKVNILADPGITSLNVALSGTNVWNEEIKENYTIDGTTGIDVSATGVWCSENYIPLIPNTNYYLKSPSYLNARWYDANKNYLGYSVLGSNVIFNSTTSFPNASYLRFNGYGAPYNHDISINYPATDTGYHPYSGENHDISLGRTVTDGWLDVTNGKLHIGNNIYDVTPESFTGISGTNYIYSSGGDVEVKYIRRLDS